MSDYLTEEDQIAEIKKLWKDYGLPSLIAVAIGLGLNFGWQHWKAKQLEHRYEASLLYESLLMNADKDDTAKLQKTAATLVKDYVKTPYAAMAQLFQGKTAVEKKDLPAATNAFTWVEQHAKDKSLQQLARNRHARVLLAQKQFDAATTLLATVNDAAFTATIENIKGDIYAAEHQLKKAKHAYHVALSHYPKDIGARALVEMKYDQIG